MVNRILITTSLIALFVILALNVLPFFWEGASNVYLLPHDISGMAIRHSDRLFTLNYEQQSHSIEILNRSIPVGTIDHAGGKPLNFDQIVIYRFNASPVHIKPIAWLPDGSLYYNAPEWSPSPLKEVSKGELYDILTESYDRKPYR